MIRKKVLFLTSWYPTRLSPKNGDFVQRHAQAVSLLHDVVILHIAYDANMKSRKELIITNRNGLNEHILYFRLPSIFKMFKPIAYIYLYLKYFKQIERKYGKPNIIHANVIQTIGLITLILSKVYRIPFVLSEHWSGFSPLLAKNIAKLHLFLFRKIAKNAKCIMPVSELLKENMQNLDIKANYSIIGNVVDVSLFKPLRKEKRKTHRILHVSTVNLGLKNVHGILRTIKKLSQIRQDFVLDVVSSDAGNTIMQYAKELSIEPYIIFHGSKNYEELAAMYAESSFFLLFSNYETFSCVVIESFAAGIPVVCTKSVGVAPYINSSNGLLVDSGDENQLVENLDIMLDTYTNYNPQNLHEYAQNNFSYLAIAQSFDKIYNSIELK